MLKLNSVMIGTAHRQAMSEFYEKIFNKKADWSEEGWYGWQVGSTHFMIGEHSEVKGKAKEPQRVMVNLETEKVKEEFERIKGLGAKVLKELYQMDGEWIGTFADPDGNYFQIVSPWKMHNK
jgi:predicted enzyme related to lactoylglutathione lyase